MSLDAGEYDFNLLEWEVSKGRRRLTQERPIEGTLDQDEHSEEALRRLQTTPATLSALVFYPSNGSVVLTSPDCMSLSSSFPVPVEVHSLVLQGCHVQLGSSTHVTFLDTELAASSISLTGSSSTLVLASSLVHSNKGTPGVQVSGTNTLVTLRGFTRVHSNQNPTGKAGGLLIQGGATLVVEDESIVELNSALNGGGVYLGAGSRLETKDVALVASNSVSMSGGGLFMEASSMLACFSCQFVGNSAGALGGGILVSVGGVASLKQAGIHANQALQGGGIYVGGVLDVRAVVAFSENRAQEGGGVYSNLAQVNLYSPSSLDFKFNLGVRSAGGMYLSPGSSSVLPHLDLSSVSFQGNLGGSAPNVLSLSSLTSFPFPQRVVLTQQALLCVGVQDGVATPCDPTLGVANYTCVGLPLANNHVFPVHVRSTGSMIVFATDSQGDAISSPVLASNSQVSSFTGGLCVPASALTSSLVLTSPSIRLRLQVTVYKHTDACTQGKGQVQCPTGSYLSPLQDQCFVCPLNACCADNQVVPDAQTYLVVSDGLPVYQECEWCTGDLVNGSYACAQGRQGELCLACAPGYYGEACDECFDYSLSLLFVVLGSVWMVCLATWLSYTFLFVGAPEEPEPRRLDELSLSKFKQVAVFLQAQSLMFSFTGAYAVPAFLGQFWQVCAVVGGQVPEVAQCLGVDMGVVLRACVLTGVVLLGPVCLWMYYQVMERKTMQITPSFHETKRQAGVFVLVVVWLSQVASVKEGFAAMASTSVVDQVLGIGYLWLIIAILFPSIVFLRIRHHLNKYIRKRRRVLDNLKPHYGFLFANLKSSAWWWDLWRFLLLFLFALVGSLLERFPNERTAVGCLVLAMGLSSSLMLNPFHENALNNVEVLLWLQLLVILVLLTFLANLPEVVGAVEVMFTLLFFVAFFVVGGSGKKDKAQASSAASSAKEEKKIENSSTSAREREVVSKLRRENIELMKEVRILKQSVMRRSMDQQIGELDSSIQSV